MRDSSYNSAEANASTCKRCSSPKLFIEPQGIHIGLFCHDCQLWQRWVPKTEAHRYQTAKPYPQITEQLRADFDSPRDDSHESCNRRFEKIERELTVLLRAVLSFGTLQGKGGPPATDVDSERVYDLAETLAREEGG